MTEFVPGMVSDERSERRREPTSSHDRRETPGTITYRCPVNDSFIHDGTAEFCAACGQRERPLTATREEWCARHGHRFSEPGMATCLCGELMPAIIHGRPHYDWMAEDHDDPAGGERPESVAGLVVLGCAFAAVLMLLGSGLVRMALR